MHKRIARVLLAGFAITLSACDNQDPMMSNQKLPAPPMAVRKAHTFTHHGITVDDPYHWLRDPGYPTVDDPEILAYLEAENAYFEAFMAPHQALVDTLFEEIKARQQPDESAVPWKDGDYLYRWRFEADAQYRIWERWPVGDSSAVEIILDGPTLAKDHDYFRLGTLAVSPNGRFLAYATDTDGSERFNLVFKDLRTGALLPDTLNGIGSGGEWAADNRTFFYPVLTENWRPYQIKSHRLGETTSQDPVIYEEQDPAFFVGVHLTQSREYLLITTGDHITNENYYLPSAEPTATPRLIAPRRTDHRYSVDHVEDAFYVLTNDQHKNFRLARTPIAAPGEDNWETVIAGSDDHYLTDFVCFRDILTVEERRQGLDQIRIRGYDGSEHYIAFPEAAYTASIGTNAEFDVQELRLGYDSMVTPDTVFDYVLETRELITRKVREIPSGYDREQYATERLWAPARDGVRVPVSIVYRKGLVRDGSAPLYLYGYGAYGLAMPPSFTTSRLSLLDRGFVYAIAHIRGGDDLGYSWYEDGKLTARENTFNDFVDVARHLITEKYTSAGRIAIAGGSAGGTLMGAAVNQAPALWGAVAAHVPFVDVLSTVLDAELPLTPIEWPEWGNPIEDKAAFELIQGYSPYDQLTATSYPPMLVTAGLNDPRVTYWEPAKYVAKLRSLKTDDQPLVLKTNMGAGHGGKSGRFESLFETAEEYAFFIVTLDES
jgi:oligopeptidase B